MPWNENQRTVYRIPVRAAGEPEAADRAPAQRGDQVSATTGDSVDWQALALRLQAEMENFRKRQARRAEEAAAAERAHLLRQLLPVADNLDRALNHNGRDFDSLRHGVELTHRELLRSLAAEGVSRVESVGQPFSPEWHEAVATVENGAEPGLVVEEIEPGYKLGDKLLRPARVIVAA